MRPLLVALILGNVGYRPTECFNIPYTTVCRFFANRRIDPRLIRRMTKHTPFFLWLVERRHNLSQIRHRNASTVNALNLGKYEEEEEQGDLLSLYRQCPQPQEIRVVEDQGTPTFTIGSNDPDCIQESTHMIGKIKKCHFDSNFGIHAQ